VLLPVYEPLGTIHWIDSVNICKPKLRCFSQKHLRCLGSRLVYFAARGARQKSRTSKEGRKARAGRKAGRKGGIKEGRKEGNEGRKEGRKGGREGGRKEGTSTDGVESVEIAWK